MKLVKLSIREFAMPSPRTGSIESQSGYGRTSLEGIEIHQWVQQKRARDHDDYESEVKLSQMFERDGFSFLVEGRMDGIFTSDLKIEEIKSTFNVHELRDVLKERKLTHPYGLQLATYGYFYFLEHAESPDLTFHLVSTRNRESLDLELEFDLEKYRAWLEVRLDELVIEAKRAEKRSARRRKISEKFPFPFENPRTGQVELIETIEQGMSEKKRMLIQAPTGLGKTIGVLYPTLKEALKRGQRVVYLTPKNSQHTVAEDAIERFQENGSALKSLTITAKSKMCFKAEPLCNPTYCEFARDYYDKVAKNDLHEVLSKKKKLNSRVFKKLGEEFEVCPFELQFEAAQEADTIICDYNYVFAASGTGRLPPSGFAQEGKSNLVIDEAHNLPSRAMGYYSPALSGFVLEKMRGEIRELPRRYAKELEELLDECISVVSSCKPPGATQTVQIDPPVEPFVEQDGKLGGYLSRYLDSGIEIQPKDPVLKLCFYWSEFTQVLQEISGADRKEFFVTYQVERGGRAESRAPGSVKITCCDASSMLKPCYDEYEQVVGFSATLKPFDYYSRLSGLEGDDLKVAEFQTPFDPHYRKLLIIPQISTKFSERERNYSRIAETISRIANLKKGNYFAFFPSFDFLERVLQLFSLPSGFQLVKQERNMPASEVEDLLSSLREEASSTIVFGVQGGVFSEGVDYPGKMLIGAFVVGPPLPSFDVERETMKKYYQEHYREGFDYAYAYPAMAKAIQAAGRVIRSETDHGVIVLMDSRFLEKSYTQTMPKDWFLENPRELVSSQILKDVEDFWNSF